MFFKSLFDFKFESFVTRQVASVLYAILVVGAGLFGVFAIVYGLTRQQAYLIVLVPIVYLVYIILMRVLFESSIALVAIAENTKKDH
jgi:ABC-type methionine transport system permease subunit